MVVNTFEQGFTWARHALDMIQKHMLSPTPNNYALFFAHVSGQNPNLSMSIETLVEHFGHLTQEQCDHLYTAHIGIESERKALAEMNSTLDGELKKVLGLLDNVQEGTKGYTASLDDFSEKLTVASSIQQVRDMVMRVAQETRSIAIQNQRLQTQLLASAEQVLELRYNLDMAQRETLTDPLTNVGNRRFFQQEIDRLLLEREQNNEPLALLMIDIDHFKRFNDTYGHQTGDQVLRLVARTLIDNVKGRDVVARYGGEEFAVLLPSTRLADAVRVAEHLRLAVGTRKITRRQGQESLGSITLSVGITAYAHNDDVETIVERADRALYRAKSEGRNRVSVDDPSTNSDFDVS